MQHPEPWQRSEALCIAHPLTSQIPLSPHSIDQLLVPNMLAGLKPLAQMDAWHFCERVLGLALPNLYVWLLGFVIVSGEGGVAHSQLCFAASSRASTPARSPVGWVGSRGFYIITLRVVMPLAHKITSPPTHAYPASGVPRVAQHPGGAHALRRQALLQGCGAALCSVKCGLLHPEAGWKMQPWQAKLVPAFSVH